MKNLGFPCGSGVKNTPVNSGDTGSVPGLERSPGEGNGNPLRSSCLENSTERSLAGYSPWGRKRVGHDLGTKQQQKERLAGKALCLQMGKLM